MGDSIWKKVESWGFIGLAIIWIGFFINYYYFDNSLLLLFFFIVLAYLIILISSLKLSKEVKITFSKDLDSSQAAQQAVKILSNIYAVIAGLSLITATKEITSMKVILFGIADLTSRGHIFTWLGNAIIFFITSLPFYHGASMYLIINYNSDFPCLPNFQE